MLSSFVKEEKVSLPLLSQKDWEEVYELAQQHKLELAVYETVYQTESFRKMPQEWRHKWKQQVRYLTVAEMRKVERFWEIYDALVKAGLKPLVIKGVICRFLYKKPYARPSGDEDLLIHKKDAKSCCQVLKKAGMRLENDKESMVLVFNDTLSGLHLEVHKELFDEGAYSGELFNSWFVGAFDSTVELEVEGKKIRSMEPTLHMLYLFLHWIKHFIGPGVGVRQICDISKYINSYGYMINWDFIWKKLKKERYDVLCANVLDIGQRYFGLDKKCMQCPEGILEGADSADLLEDLLDAGIYGSSSTSRLHSSSITLDAVRGKKGRMRILFPPVKNIRSRYAFLEKSPWLLPAVWVHRLICYIIEVGRAGGGENSPSASIAIGNSRTHLLKKYRVVK